jgi:aryl-alcohol dehydrogenase-like predicted oxidoreductase
MILRGEDLEKRQLGSTGITVSALGFGCGAVGGLMTRGRFEDQVAAVKRALDAGITYFDTAPLYGEGASEENLGRVLRELGAWDRVAVGTKVRLTTELLADPQTGVYESVHKSLERLGRDRLDLLQLHNPLSRSGGTERGSVSSDELAAVQDAMQRMVDDGRIGHLGFTGLGDTPAIKAAIDTGRFETMQSYFNAINASAGYPGAATGEQDFGGVIDAAADRGMGVIAIRVMAAGAMVATTERAPLAGGTGGALVGGGNYEGDVERAQTLEPLAKELDLESPLELSFRFVFSKPGVSTVLVGYSDIDQLESAIRWAERGKLSDEAVQKVVSAAL